MFDSIPVHSSFQFGSDLLEMLILVVKEAPLLQYLLEIGNFIISFLENIGVELLPVFIIFFFQFAIPSIIGELH